MRKKNYKGKCVKKTADKSETVCKTYDAIQLTYLNVLDRRDDIRKIHCSVPLDGETCGEYMTDFLCEKNRRQSDGT